MLVAPPKSDTHVSIVLKVENDRRLIVPPYRGSPRLESTLMTASPPLPTTNFDKSCPPDLAVVVAAAAAGLAVVVVVVAAAVVVVVAAACCVAG